jgi:ABC-2 type transport system ATP-binding protein
MEIQLYNTGKKFHRKWIFRGLDLSLQPGSRTAIAGSNGSGKSTLLLMLAGYLSASEGRIIWLLNRKKVLPAEVFQHISLSSPAMELIEEYTLAEAIRFHRKFRPFIKDMDVMDLIGISGLGMHPDKPVRQYSSGMKQRVKLLFSVMMKSDLLLLDEPCSHLDREGISWYHGLMREFGEGRTTVIASNHHPEEYPDTSDFINLG